jgi:hypothetical protein
MSKNFSQQLGLEEAATPPLDLENDENGLNFIG